jgi:hypothetical protein
MASPTIASGVITTNNYMIVTFSEGVYTTASHNTPIVAADFTIALGGSGTATNVVINGTLRKPDNTVLTPTGGDSVVRFNLTWTGIPDGNETVTITVASGTAVYNVTAEAMAAGQNTGAQSAIALLTLYCSKAGNDGNDGYTTGTSKLTLSAIQSILQQGYNKVYIGVGDYVDTAAWSATGNTSTEIYGDYDGAIFGGGAGEVIHSNSALFNFNSVTRVDRMTLKLTTGSRSYFPYSNLFLSTPLVFNYCVFRTTGLGCSFNYYVTDEIVKRDKTLNYCSLDTGAIIFDLNVDYSTITFNHWDNITGGQPLICIKSSPANVVFNNSDILFDSYLFSWASQNWIISNSTLKQYDANSTLIENYSKFIAGAVTHKRLCTIKDSDLLNNTGSSIDPCANLRINYVTSTDNSTASASGYRTDAIHYGIHSYKILMDNINSNSKKILLTPGGCILDGDTDTHNLKSVFYYHATLNAGYQIYTIKVRGLAVSTEYDLTFDYLKAENSINSDFDVRFGVLKGNQAPRDDLYTTPANALDYLDCLASSHTYDTWYDSKTLTFTTTSDETDEYFLVFYNKGATVNFKITKPSVVIH